jgi:hypothetical protein
MGSVIVFAAARGENPLVVRVEEEINAVQRAWTEAKGLPFGLTNSNGSGKVWINPATIAYWHKAPSGPKAG